MMARGISGSLLISQEDMVQVVWREQVNSRTPLGYKKVHKSKSIAGICYPGVQSHPWQKSDIPPGWREEGR